MNHSKLYVPDAQKWIEFLKQMSTKQKLTQTGGGRMLHMTSGENINTKSVILNSVAPAQQTVEQAKSELKREDINPTIVKKTIHKSNSCSKRYIKKRSVSHRKNSANKSSKKVKKSDKKTHKISIKRKEFKKEKTNKRKEFKKNLKQQSDKKRKNIKNKNIKTLLKKDILGY